MSIFILVVNLAFAPGMTTTAHRTGVKAKSEVVFFTDQGKAILAARKEEGARLFEIHPDWDAYYNGRYPFSVREMDIAKAPSGGSVVALW